MVANHGLYSEDDIRDIAVAANDEPISPYWLSRLQEAAQTYQVLRWSERHFMSKRGERRTALRNLAEAACTGRMEGVSAALSELDYHGINAIPKAALDDLAALADAAYQAASEVPYGGEEPKRARRYFVCFLAAMYQRITKRRATRAHIPETPIDDSPFIRFCKAALRPLPIEHDDTTRLVGPDEPLDPIAFRGLNDDVRAVVTRCKTCRRRHRHCRCVPRTSHDTR